MLRVDDKEAKTDYSKLGKINFVAADIVDIAVRQKGKTCELEEGL